MKEPLAKDQDKFVLRLPEGMRERIKASADRNGRSMNAEIVQALEQIFPPEPSVEDILQKVHRAIEQAGSANNLPYRAVLIDALEDLSTRLSSGIEFEQYQSKTRPPHAVGMDTYMDRMDRWRRAKKYGVEQSDLEREIANGLFRRGMGGADGVQAIIKALQDGKTERAMKMLRLDSVRFAEPEKAYAAIEADLSRYYRENWGDGEEDWIPDND